MKLDDTAKVVAIFSTIITAVISISGVVGNRRLQKLEGQIKGLEKSGQAMDLSKKRYDYAARLTVEFALPLARSFALQFANEQAVGRTIAMPTDDLAREFAQTTPAWEARRGLMTGSACQAQGLKARQIVTLIVTNIGNTDATDIVMTVRQKRSPSPDPRVPWQEHDARGSPAGYDGLAGPSARWQTIDLPVPTLRGMGSPTSARTPLQIVLASVSGTSSLYGTILVPVRIAWTDSVSKQRQSLPVYAEHAAELRANLLGAEIGSLGATCRQTQGTS